jgi:uncharacterized repeat protein (TIGR01451 family)
MFIVCNGNAQTSTVLMQRCLGDSSNTSLYCATKTIDGGYIAGGWVTGNTGDVSGYKGGPKDGWIVKLNLLGGVEWQRCFGGSWIDMVNDIVQTSDGGYIAVGSTASYDGDITSTHSAAGKLADDAFVVKLSSTGQVMWSKCYGGNSVDEFKKIISTSDGGFLCVGSTRSGDGDVVGFHAAITTGAKDVWVVKIDAAGTMQWNKAYGAGSMDQAVDVVATTDGNYIIGAEGVGYGQGDISTWYGGGDAWLIKISPTGDIIWEKTYGGSQDEHAATIIPATDGGFMIAFLTYSNDGMCSQNNSGGAGITDIALFKIAEDGSAVWTKCFGGGAYEWFGNLGYPDDRRGGLLATADGGYILCGSTSSADGQVTGLHGEIMLGMIGDNYDQVYWGPNDAWVVKVSQSGILQWQKCFGGSYEDYGQGIVQGSDATQFLVLGYVNSNDGDVSGNKIIEQGNGTDGWIAKIKAGNTITGLVFKDNNLNGVQDAGEPLVSNAMVKSSNPTSSFTSLTNNGRFINLTDTGQFATTVTTYLPYFTVVPSSITTPFHSTYYNSDTINFALQPISGNTDLVVNAFSPSFMRLGRDVQYKVIVRNVGTVNIPSGILKFVKDHRLIYKSATPNVSSVTADTITWNYNTLNAGDTMVLLVTMTLPTPPLANLNDTLRNVISVSPVNNDVTPGNDTIVTKDVIIGSFDPNDKAEIHGGIVSSEFASSGEYLQYTIRFQNTGNDTAFNVIVKDTLDSKLDWSTMQMVNSSHPVIFSIVNDNQLTWTFANINLVDSNTNEPLSHGYVVYQVQPKTNVIANDVIHNDASIYFDYNFPVLTNDATTFVQSNIVALPTRLLQFLGNRQNTTVNLFWEIADPGSVHHFEVERSTNGNSFSFAGRSVSSQSGYSFTDNISALPSNTIYYRLKVVEQDGKYYYSKILLFRSNPDKEQFSVYPNPTSNDAFVSLQSEEDCIVLIKVIDVSGKIMTVRKERVNKGQTIIELTELNRFIQGQYLIQLQKGEWKQSQWLLKLNR